MHRPIPRRRLTAVLLCSLATLASVAAVPAEAADWPQYRGPAQTGAVAGSGNLPAGSFGLEVAWKQKIGPGYSGISIAGERAVTQFTDGKEDLLAAWDTATGRELWRYSTGPMYKGHDGSADGPIGSPTIHDGVVYGLSARGRLFAVSLADGKERWTRQLDTEKEARAPFYGFSTSPVVDGDRLIVLTGRAESRTVTAFRRADGTPVWTSGEEAIGYQTPLLTELGGRRQIVVAGNRELLGLDAERGTVLWKHRLLESGDDGFALPLPMGEDRLLINFQEDAAAVQVVRSGETWSVKPLWRNNNLKSSFGIPVYHQGSLYGYSGRFLTCVDAETGSVRWKSRPPGGAGVILVDGHLAILGAQGELVIAEAHPERYVEKARLKVFEREGLTAPSFAGGRFFVRNEAEIASLRLASGGAVAAAGPTPLDLAAVGGSFGAALAEVDRAPAAEKAAKLDALLARHTQGPVVEADGRTHFLYRGTAQDVALTGNVLPAEQRDGLPLRRLAGTDLFVASLALCADCVYDYGLSVDLGTSQPDPRNPHRIASGDQESSELRMPGWKVPTHLAEPQGGARGKLEEMTFRSAVRGDERKLQVYLPAGYETGTERYPLLLVFHGDVQLTTGKMVHALDNLVGRSVEPLIAVFLPRSSREYTGTHAADFTRALAEELVPQLDQRYRTRARPEARGLLGTGSGAFAALHTIFRQPGTFGRVALQSYNQPASWGAELLKAIAEKPRQDLFIYLEEARFDLLAPANQVDAQRDTRQIKEALTAKGYSVTTREVSGAPGWAHWRAQSGAILETLFGRSSN